VFRDLTSRMCAVALVIALLAKACLGLVQGPPANADSRPSAAGAAAVELLHLPGTPCAKLCLNVRLEDAETIPGRLKSSLPHAPFMIPLREHWQSTSLVKADQLVVSRTDDIRTRLAMLGRLLL
jgi:hypothetical protein